MTLVTGGGEGVQISTAVPRAAAHQTERGQCGQRVCSALSPTSAPSVSVLTTAWWVSEHLFVHLSCSETQDSAPKFVHSQ